MTQTVTRDGGMIRVGNAEFWSARANPPVHSIEVGSQVRIAYVDGLTAYVEPSRLPVRQTVRCCLSPRLRCARRLVGGEWRERSDKWA